MTSLRFNRPHQPRALSPTQLSKQLLLLCVGGLMVHSSAFAQTQSEVAQNVVELPVIKAYAKQSEQDQQKIKTLDQTQMQREGVTDMASVVKYLPLVTAPKAISGSGNAWDSSGTSGYNIRGVDGNRVGIDVDGVDLSPSAPRPDSYQTTTSGVGRDFIDPEMFSQVDIYSGTTGAQSDGIGGRVSFKTLSPEDYLTAEKQSYAAYKAGYSSADESWLNRVTAAAGNDTVQALIAYAHRQGKETKSAGKLKENPVDWNSDAVLTRLLWNLSSQQQLGFTFDYYSRDVERYIDADTLGKNNYPRGGHQVEDAERRKFALDYRLNQATPLFDQLKLQTYYQDTQNDNVTDAFYTSSISGTFDRRFENGFENKIWGVKADANKAWQNHSIQYGIGASRSDDNRPWVETNLDKQTTKNQSRMVETENDKYYAYVTDEMSFQVLDRTLKLKPGLRYEYQSLDPKNVADVFKQEDVQNVFKKTNTDYLAPSLSLSYQLAPHSLSYFNYKRGVRIPTAAEMMGSYDPGMGYNVVGNSKLKEEKSDAFELGLKTQPIKGINIDLTGFYTEYQDFIDYIAIDKALGVRSTRTSVPKFEPFTLQIQNISDVNIWGGEITARVDLGEFFPTSDGFSLGLAAGKAKASGSKKDGSKAAINSVQPEQATLSFNYDAPDQVYGLSFKTTAVGSRTAGEDRVYIPGGQANKPYRKVSGYAVSDISAYWNINKYATLNLGLNNIFDQKYHDYAKVGLLTNTKLIDRATETGRNVFASVEFKY